jgi:NifU-like protein
MAWDYSEKTKQLFMDAVHGKPGTHLGEIENADGIGEHGSIACGDSMRFTFRVRRHPTDPLQDVITEARYLTFGCTSAIAASEALCHIIEGKSLTPPQALKITNQDIVEYLGGLPEQKIHCSVMGAEALEAAVFNWSQRRGIDPESIHLHLKPQEEEDGRLVCKCFNVTEPYLRRKIKELNLRTIAEITNAIKAGGACMSCHQQPGGLQDILDEIWGKSETRSVDSSSRNDQELRSPSEKEVLSPYQLSKKIERMIEEQVRPNLKKDGGDVEIIDIKDRLVYCRLIGACRGCAGAGMTLKLMIEKTLQDKIDENIRVISV